jgi:prepilin-type N-terminal cleavage/methylation domain-containing protein
MTQPSIPMPKMRTHSPRSGFTLLELIITFAIIGLLLALYVPALTVAREAARRTQCQNNLKQIGLGLVNYHELFQTFPPGYVARGVTADDDATRETGPGFAWGLLLLDFLDQSPLASTIIYEQDATDPQNAAAMSTVMPMWRCPSSEAPFTFDLSAGLSVYLLSSTNYVGMYGVGDMTASPGRPAAPGAFYRNSHTRTWTIGDGLSHTILVGERAAWHEFVPRAAGVPANSTWFAAIPGATRPAGVESVPLMMVGPASLVLGTVGTDLPGLETLRPNHANFIGAFSSGHEGGLNVNLADSSVRFLSDQVDPRVLHALAQTNAGGAVDDF